MTSVVESIGRAGANQVELSGGFSHVRGVMYYTREAWAASRATGGEIETTYCPMQAGSGSWLIAELRANRQAAKAVRTWWGDVPETLAIRLAAGGVVAAVCAPLVWAAGRTAGSAGARAFVEAGVLLAALLFLVIGGGVGLRRNGTAAMHAAEHLVANRYSDQGAVTASPSGGSRLHPLCGVSAALWIGISLGGGYVFARLSVAGPAYLLLLALLAPLAMAVGIAVHALIGRLPRWIGWPFQAPGLLLQSWLTAEPSARELELAAAALNRLADGLGGKSL